MVDDDKLRIPVPLAPIGTGLLTALVGMVVLFLTGGSVAAYVVVCIVGFSVAMGLAIAAGLRTRRLLEQSRVDGRIPPYDYALPRWAKRVGIGYLWLFSAVVLVSVVLLVAAAISKALD